jgi:hypothetical protein
LRYVFAAVKAEMETLGAPIIRAYRVEGDLYYAVEGCHRLRAAAELGLVPEIDEIEPDKPITIQWDGEDVEMAWDEVVDVVLAHSPDDEYLSFAA